MAGEDPTEPTDLPSSELALIASQLEPAVTAFKAAANQPGPVAEIVEWITDQIRYRRLPHKANLLMSAAHKIKASGLPAHAVPDRTLRDVLEDGSLEDDESMQERWANLLAHGAVSEDSHPAFPGILRELSSEEASMLEAMFVNLEAEASGAATQFHSHTGFNPSFFVDAGITDAWRYPVASTNLSRLQLAQVMGHYPGGGSSVYQTTLHQPLSSSIQPTYFGLTFVAACLPPIRGGHAVLTLQRYED
jgi:Abortive infection alpha